MDPARKPATYADLLVLPEHVKAEIVHGEIRVQPSPTPEHAWVVGGLGEQIDVPFSRRHGRGGPGGWWLLADIDVQFTEHLVYRPDVAGWRRERLASPWGMRPITMRPDWICEVLSPSNLAHDRVTKFGDYADQGVPHYWLIDPAERTLLALRLADCRWVQVGRYADGDTVHIPPFEAVAIEVGLLFPPPPEVV